MPKKDTTKALSFVINAVNCYNMGWFKKKSEKEKLQAQYEKLMKQSFDMSKTDRTKADALYAQAEAIAKKIENLPQ